MAYHRLSIPQFLVVCLAVFVGGCAFRDRHVNLDYPPENGAPPTAGENIVVGGAFPGSFKLPGPDRPPPPPSR